MTSKAKTSKEEKPLTDVVMLDRKPFLSAISLVSTVLQAMGEEFEGLRTNEQMDPEVRRALLQMLKAHLHNVSHISHALNLSFHDVVDPDGTLGRDMN